MDPRKVAQEIIALGEAWGKGQSEQRVAGIVAATELIAKGQVVLYEKDGEVYWALPEHRHRGGKACEGK